MKLLKTLLLFAIGGGLANAATITVSSGLPAQGITPTLNSTALAGFTFAVGVWDGTTSTFTQFGSAIADTGKVGGAGGITATADAALFNSKLIAVFVGTGSTIAASGTNWVVFTATAGTAFPSDVTQATGVTFAMTLPSVLNVAATGAPTNGFSGNNYNFAPIPEPSTALLGLLGVAGLIRRRR